MDTKDDVMLDEKAAAAMLNLQPKTLTVWRCKGRGDLPYHKFGRCVRYSLADVIAWRDRQRVSFGPAVRAA